MIKAIALDDEPLSLEILEQYAAKIPFLKLEKTFTQVKAARQYLDKFPVDLLFLDIQMPSLTGLDFYKGLKHSTMVIFATAHSQYAVEGFELSAVDYLLKPYSFERFETAVNKANDFYQFTRMKASAGGTGDQAFIFVRSEYSLVKIATSDITHIEGFADYLKIYTDRAMPVVTRMTMKSILEKLPAHFIRVHRSYIVPLPRIESVRNRTISIGTNKIPLGVSYFDAFKKAYHR
jgi:DNA-binding LytR/AlgR family response regulator